MFSRTLKSPPTITPDPRARLRELHAARDQARTATQVQRAALDVAAAPLEVARTADRRARDAQAFADNALGDQKRIAQVKANDLEREAEGAWRVADAADAQLELAQAALDNAKDAVRSADREIDEEIALMLARELEPHLATLEKAAREYTAARHVIDPVLVAIGEPSRWNKEGYGSSAATRLITDVLSRSEITHPVHWRAMASPGDPAALEAREDLNEPARQIRERIFQLRTDANA